MKPEFEKISEKPEHSFTAKVVSRDSRPLLSQAWHYHPEIEICFTQKSNGKRFVGNQIAHYDEHDLVMFGSNLPHGFTTEHECSQVVIQMTRDFLGNEFLNRPELRSINYLFDHSKRGLEFYGETKYAAQVVIDKIMSTNGFQQMIHLFELLELLSKTQETKPICSEEYVLGFDESHLDRIKVVYDHIMDNFQKEVHIKEVADFLSLSEAAFFKFIKKHTKKTYTEIINEFRINHASKELISTDKTISQICFESGFNNISYFNRKFKRIMDMTPLEFRNQYVVQ